MKALARPLVLFHPHVPDRAVEYVTAVLGTRWIGQGPKVDEFERQFASLVGGGHSIAVGAGTDALHLAYLLAGIEKDDEVVCPLFTCTATNIPLLYIGAKAVFADIQSSSMNVDPEDVRRRITGRTKAIVCVHHGGLPCDMDEIHHMASEHGLVVIEDAAHALGAAYRGRPVGQLSPFTMFSFQAVKHITTGDGGMLMVQDKQLADKARRLRWFGIDRKAKLLGSWEHDITEVGFKYQMTDIAAALGLAGLEDFDRTLEHRQGLWREYQNGLAGVDGITLVGAGYNDRSHAAWMCTILVERLTALREKLTSNGIESAQVHYRNDRYSIFGGRRADYPSMDHVESRYAMLPLHTRMDVADVERVCAVIRSGW
jgi:dTDP-4-amino-4,6-dideoxygalactose transaminase